MKSTLQKVVRRIINNNFLWVFVKPFAVFGNFAYHNRKKTAKNTDNEPPPYLSLFSDLKVLYGPFAGMKYASYAAFGSSLYSKFLGCYEKELHGVIENLFQKNYTEILDIGCAEGYYAIGFALKTTSAKIYAYDIEQTARDLCFEMAKFNNVEDKVIIRDSCTPEVLADFQFTGKGLVICDCEGYEKYLFSQQNIENLKKCDLLIETHDFIDINISVDLIKLFSATHNIQVVKSIDDIEKAQTYSFSETNHLSLEERRKVFMECRPAIMDWLICTPK